MDTKLIIGLCVVKAGSLFIQIDSHHLTAVHSQKNLEVAILIRAQIIMTALI